MSFQVQKYNINALTDDWIIDGEINQTLVKMQIDTGAKCNVMSLSTYNSLNIKYSIENSKAFLRSYSRHKLPAIGNVNLKCKIKNMTTDVKFQVVDIEAQTILGAETCQKLGIVQRIYSVKKLLLMKKFLMMYLTNTQNYSRA